MNFVKRKKGQEGPMGMSFGVIFAIFLIIIFIFAAGFGIKKFLGYSKCNQIGMFYENLQREVNDAFYAQSAENKKLKISLPSSIKKVCFANLSAPITYQGEEYDDISQFEFEEANVFLFPSDDACGLSYKKIEKLNIQKITERKNPYCVSTDEELTFKKGIYDKYVIVE